MVVKAAWRCLFRPRGVQQPAACALQGATQSEIKFYSTKPILQGIFPLTTSASADVHSPHPHAQTNKRLHNLFRFSGLLHIY
jgi:hypothetical protein